MIGTLLRHIEVDGRHGVAVRFGTAKLLATREVLAIGKVVLSSMIEYTSFT
jgi:hypothetical protein